MAKIVINARGIKSSTGRVIEQVLNNLQQLDSVNDYKILVLEKEKDYYKPTKPNFEVVVADYAHYSFGEQLGFALFLYRMKADLVYFHMPQQPLLYIKPTVTFVHDLNQLRLKESDMSQLELKVKKVIFACLLWIVSKRSKHIIVPTEYSKNDLMKFAHISPSKITVSSEGVIQIGKLEPMPQFDKKPFIIYLGRAEPYKNNRRLIKAHQSLLGQHPKLSLVIAGPIDELRRADIDWVKSNSYKNVLFAEWPTDEQAAWLYKRAEAFVQPSLMEGFGLPVLEAMQQGVPVASTNATCSPEVYGDAAHYFNPNDTEDIARAINDLLTDQKLRTNLIKKGYQQVKKYSWPKASQKIFGVIKDVLKQND